MRSKILNNAVNKDALVLEFDYAQNLPLPRIPVNYQFYKRLLWYFIFNVHLFERNKFYMFTFIEGEAKKGANSVCSFLWRALSENVVPETKLLFC